MVAGVSGYNSSHSRACGSHAAHVILPLQPWVKPQCFQGQEPLWSRTWADGHTQEWAFLLSPHLLKLNTFFFFKGRMPKFKERLVKTKSKYFHKICQEMS